MYRVTYLLENFIFVRSLVSSILCETFHCSLKYTSYDPT